MNEQLSEQFARFQNNRSEPVGQINLDVPVEPEVQADIDAYNVLLESLDPMALELEELGEVIDNPESVMSSAEATAMRRRADDLYHDILVGQLKVRQGLEAMAPALDAAISGAYGRAMGAYKRQRLEITEQLLAIGFPGEYACDRLAADHPSVSHALATARSTGDSGKYRHAAETGKFACDGIKRTLVALRQKL